MTKCNRKRMTIIMNHKNRKSLIAILVCDVIMFVLCFTVRRHIPQISKILFILAMVLLTLGYFFLKEPKSEDDKARKNSFIILQVIVDAMVIIGIILV